METFGPNPMVIEDDDLNQLSLQRLTPLVLIHDGSGLIFHYFALPKLNRPVYALYDPHFFNNKQWDGGIQEQATAYWNLMKDEVPSGNVILGGWSLGGIVALQMFLSRQVAPEYTITGILMIDSVCPRTLQSGYASSRDDTGGLPKTAISYTPKYNSHTSMTTRKHIANSGDRTELSMQAWKAPAWGNIATDDKPPIIMLRATEYVPLQDNDIKNSGHDEPEGLVYSIDLARERRQLGWEEVDRKLCSTVLDIPGHHYSVLDADNIDTLHRQMQRALKSFK